VSTEKLVLFALLLAITALFIVAWVRNVRRQPPPGGMRPTLLETAVGFVTNFFDTLGIGSFAPTTSVFKLKQMVPDERIPGTLNVGHALPTVAEALVFIAIVGAWLGAGVVASWPRRRVQIGMGATLLVAAVLFAMTNLKLIPGGGDALSLHGWLFAAGVVGNFALGALMTLGIGLYAPCMILVSLLGMNPIAAFPIMMGSCAFLMPVGSLRFIEKGSYRPRTALGLAVGGVPGVLIAAFIVKSLPLTALRWGVILVVLYAAGAMLRSARRP